MIERELFVHATSIILITCVVIGIYYELAEHRRFLILEISIDCILVLDILYRWAKLHHDFFKDIYNLLDVVSIIVITIHWIVFLALPLFDEIDFFWVLIRYCVQLCRLYYFIHANVTSLTNIYYKNKKYTRVLTDDSLEVTEEDTHVVEITNTTYHPYKEYGKCVDLFPINLHVPWENIPNGNILILKHKVYFIEIKTATTLFLFVFLNMMTKCHVMEKKKDQLKYYYDQLTHFVALDDNNQIDVITINKRWTIRPTSKVFLNSGKTQKTLKFEVWHS